MSHRSTQRREGWPEFSLRNRRFNPEFALGIAEIMGGGVKRVKK
jgi:hypothetical protein